MGHAFQKYLKGNKEPVVFLGRTDCDLTNTLLIKKILSKLQPRVIINVAAYTAVDNAENINEQKLAFTINAIAPKIMAEYISKVPGGIFIHYSTDYVFADTKKTAYFEADTPGPINQLCVYGQTKLVGEQKIQEVFKFPNNSKFINDELNKFKAPKFFIFRTSWVYGNGSNFISSILRLSTERDLLKVVADQFGTPTSANWLAEVGVDFLNSNAESGIYNAVPDGEVSWYELAVFAIELATRYGQGIKIKPENIFPILSSEYLSNAKRPKNSRLNNNKIKAMLVNIRCNSKYPVWQDQVEAYIIDFVKNL